MSTKSRILDSSLILFNQEGELEQTAVSIAAAADMSPGNLYYHFKGKEPIIEALFDRFEEEMTLILHGTQTAVRSIEDSWVFTYIVLEEIYDFRFFYRNLGELMERYPDLADRFRAILALKRDAIETVLKGLEKQGLLEIDRRLKPALVTQIVSTLTFWLSLETIEGRTDQVSTLIHDTVLQVMLLIVPYLGEDSAEILSDMLERHRELTSI